MRFLPRSWSSLLALTVVAVTLTGCGEEPRAELGSSRVENLDVDPSLRPAVEPVPSGPVQTRRPVTVVDTGSGPQVCVEGVLATVPPQCTGLPVEGWSWEERPHQVEGGVRWVERVVLTGTLDGQVLTVADARDATDDATAWHHETPCPTPASGWRVEDPASATQEALDMAILLAEEQYDASTWFDLTGVLDGPAAPGLHTPTEGILNVSTTEAPATVERIVRTVWGGKLCVSRAYETRAEVRRSLELLPGVLYVDERQGGRFRAQVLFDDGSLEQWAAEEHGDAVEVSGFFVPAEDAGAAGA